MRYLSVCSGIEAASVAWHPLGWEPLAFSEIEPFPRSVLAHHYPDVPCHGDFTKLRDMPMIADADVLVGGTPCQAFSVAGLRKSLNDDRGNLSLEFVRLADAIDDLRHAAGREPAIVVWENVPGVLSVKDNAFGCFLAGLAGDVTPYDPPRGKWTDAGVVDGPQRTVAWRVLDAQYFGLAQRRRRVFVVASAREGFDPAAVLLEFEGVRRDTPSRREAGQVAPTIPSRSTAGGGLGTDFDCDGGVIRAFAGSVESDIAATIQTTCHDYSRADGFNMVAHSLRAEGFDASEDGTGRGTPLVPVAFPANLSGTQCASAEDLAPAMGAKNPTAVAVPLQEVGKRTGTSTTDPRAGIVIGNDGDPMFTLQAGAQHGVAFTLQDEGNLASEPNEQQRQNYLAYAVSLRGREGGGTAELGDEVQNCLRASSGGGDKPHVLTHMAVRRLTPVECERLQGFPDNYTLIPWRNKPAADCPDGPRYKSLGNSMAVPVMRWIGARISEQVR